jgi:hypothetical protein
MAMLSRSASTKAHSREYDTSQQPAR